MYPDQPLPESIASDHLIETPEQMTLRFPVAGIGSRFLAMAIDTLIQAGIGFVFLIVLVILGMTGALSRIGNQGVWVVAILIFTVFLLQFSYFAVFEILWNGQTPGKRKIGIRVVKDSGRPLTAAESIGRNLMRIVDSLPTLYAIGIIVALIHAQNKRLGDLVAGSIVVREDSLATIRPVWQTTADTVDPSPSVGSASAITAHDLLLIDTFLNRRSELAANVRARMAEEILGKLRPKLALPPAPEQSAESILESLAYQRRSGGSFS